MCGFFCIFAHMNSDEIITYSVETLLRGGIILYPTDTIWGIGCDARNREAVERIYAIKERDHNKSMLLLVGSGDAENPGKQSRKTRSLCWRNGKVFWH